MVYAIAAKVARNPPQCMSLTVQMNAASREFRPHAAFVTSRFHL
jgi:hypothetical protein